MNAQRHLTPEEFSPEQVERFAIAVMGRVKELTAFGAEKPLTKVEMAEYLGCEPPHISKLVRAKILTPRRLYLGAKPRFFISDIKWQ